MNPGPRVPPPPSHKILPTPLIAGADPDHWVQGGGTPAQPTWGQAPLEKRFWKEEEISVLKCFLRYLFGSLDKFSQSSFWTTLVVVALERKRQSYAKNIQFFKLFAGFMEAGVKWSGLRTRKFLI